MGNRTGEAPPRGSSAFERTSTRSHFSILGRRLKGQSVNLAHSRSVAIEKRKLTLLQDYRQARPPAQSQPLAAPHPRAQPLQNGKAGGFIDRRFGEGDPTLDGDEKALRRLQRLRQTQFGSASRFALGGARPALGRCRPRAAHQRCRRRGGGADALGERARGRKPAGRL